MGQSFGTEEKSKVRREKCEARYHYSRRGKITLEKDPGNRKLPLAVAL